MFSLDQVILLFGTFYSYGGIVLLFLPIIMKVLPETKVLSLDISPVDISEFDKFAKDKFQKISYI